MSGKQQVRPINQTPTYYSRATSSLLTALVTFFSLLGCSQDNASNTTDQNGHLSGKLIITGSSTVAPMIAEIAKQFEVIHPAVRIDVQTGGSSRGIADAHAGLADIGMVSRNLKSNERGLTPYPIAKDGIGIIIHTDNPLTAISREQIKDIYLGRITDWQSFNDRQAPITVVNKAEGRSTLELFLEYFGLRNSEIKASIVIGDNEQGVKTVIGNKNAIGYVSIGTAEYNIQHGSPIKLLDLDGIAATSSNVALGHYPLSRTLNLVVAEDAENALIPAFINFSQSSAINPVIKELSFVPLTQ